MRYLLILLTVLIGVGCKKKGAEPTTAKITAVASNFAVFDFARIIGVDRADVTLLLPPGVESHSYEPTPKDMIRVKNCDLFVCVGLSVEPWVASIIKGAELPMEKVVESGRHVSFLTGTSCEHEEHDEDHQKSSSHCEHDKKHEETAETVSVTGPIEGGDPHIWLDPARAILMVEEIATAFIKADSVGAPHYRHRADSLKNEITLLDKRIDSTLAAAPNKTIMYAGHFAFGYFVDRYKLKHLSPYSGFSPNSEPTPAKISEMISLVKKEKIKALYFEELIEPRVARTITEETGTEMMLLHGIHNVSSTELAGTFSYLKGMEANRIALAKGLAN